MSSIHDLEQFISGHPFSKGMSDEHIKLLTGCAKNVRFHEGEFLFREGGDAETFYYIRSGKVVMELHTPPRGTIQIDSRTKDDTLGWSWMVPPYRWFCDARAAGEVRGLAFDATCLRGKWDKDAQFAYAMYQRFVPLMHRSLQVTQLQLLDIYGKN